MSTALARTGILDEPASLAHAKDVANTLAQSKLLIPVYLRDNPADILLALSMAQLLGMPPLITLQSIYVVSGRPSWSAAFIIALANRSGVFRGPIDWREEGQGESFAVTAFATLAGEEGREVAYKVSMAMARAENWTKNAKYQSMPSLMLRYRSATLLVRLYAPEVLMGLQTREELEDVQAAKGAEPAEFVVEQPERAAAPAAPVAQLEQRREEPPKQEPAPKAERKQAAKQEAERRQAAPDPLAVKPEGAHSSWPEFEESFRATVREAGLDFDMVVEVAKSRQGGASPQQMGQIRRNRYLDWLQTPEGQAAYKAYALHGEELLSQIADHHVLLGEKLPILAQCAQAAGLPVTDDGPVIDGAPDPMLRRYLNELRHKALEVSR